MLRDDLGLVGSKEGCGEGECGACSVVIDGRIINSCIIPVGYAEGLSVDTIESIRESAEGQALVEAFAAHGAVQCGFCIPGMIVAGYCLLRASSNPDEAEIREAISGNLCRCTGYDRIVAAISAAAQETGDRNTGAKVGAAGEASNG